MLLALRGHIEFCFYKHAHSRREKPSVYLVLLCMHAHTFTDTGTCVHTRAHTLHTTQTHAHAYNAHTCDTFTHRHTHI